MDFNQTITILSVIITVLSIMVAIYQIMEGRRGFLSLQQARKKNIEGTWEGTFKQDNLIDDQELNGKMSIDLKVKGKRIVGYGKYGGKFGNQSSYQEEIQLKGGFKQDRFLVLDYTNRKAEKTHFGHYILELSPDGDSLNGKLVAYGNKSKAVIGANIFLTKVL